MKSNDITDGNRCNRYFTGGYREKLFVEPEAEDSADSIMRCAIYARYSTENQNERSIPQQIGACERFADSRGWTVLPEHIYSDKAKSAATIAGRSGLDKLLSSAKLGLFKYVLIDDTSRLSRQFGASQSIIDLLKFYGVSLYFVAQGIDSANKSSRLVINTHSLIDDQYRADLAEKTSRGMKSQHLNGYATGGRIYGFISIPVGSGKEVKGCKYEVEPRQAAVVCEIFDLYISGLSPREITATLNQRGIEPPHNARAIKAGRKAVWVPNTVRNILQNRKYIGEWNFGCSESVKNPDTGRKKRVFKPKPEWMLELREDLKTVERDIFERAQRLIADRKRQPMQGKPKPKSNFLISGLMKCHMCGASYVIVTGSDRENPSFGCCRNWQAGQAGCSNNFRVKRLEVERIILQDFIGEIMSAPVLQVLMAKVNRKIQEKVKVIRSEANAITDRLAELIRAQENLVQAISAGGEIPVLVEKLREVTEDLNQVKSKQTLLNSKFDPKSFKIDEAKVREYVQRLGTIATTDPMAAKAMILPLVGEFTLAPEVIDGLKFVRLRAEAKPAGLLARAIGESGSKCLNTGGQT